MPPLPADPRPMTLRESEIRRFARARYGLRGTLRLHRASLGTDLLRAPLNVMLSPVFLLLRLWALILRLLGARRAAAWLSQRKIFLTTDLARQLKSDLHGLFGALAAKGVAPDASAERIEAAIEAHAEARNAVAELTTSALVLLAGIALFRRATPGIVTLAEPLAHLRAQTQAIRDFALGDWAGGVWYGWFPAQHSLSELVLTGLALALLAALVTAFAGLLADPVQLWAGIHQRRLMRMMARLDRNRPEPALSGEHLLARLGDIGDLAASLWRGWR
ncbi:DUF6635 family protein [Paracoccus ravus]|uniref:DUF6635 family protein n=1 Tax=Paracoccus ravus TaxID=2447760 RepID=UPI00106EC8E0|nr:DUF6635 family protein [Paracoccus ravus]